MECIIARKTEFLQSILIYREKRYKLTITVKMHRYPPPSNKNLLIHLRNRKESSSKLAQPSPVMTGHYISFVISQKMSVFNYNGLGMKIHVSK